MTASPVASFSGAALRPTITWPVLTPVRIAIRTPIALQLSLSARSASRISDGRADRTQRVVLMHLRHAEDRHDGVADELLHGAAVALEPPCIVSK